MQQHIHFDRTLARRQALQLMYQSEIVGVPVMELVAEQDSVFDGEPVGDFALMLVQGATLNLTCIDAWISETSENWSLARMPLIDRNILRLASYEMLYVDDVPCSVSINEAVELAKDYGGEDDSPRFVNGVLGYIATKIEAEDVPEEIR